MYKSVHFQGNQLYYLLLFCLPFQMRLALKAKSVFLKERICQGVYSFL